MKLGIGSSLPVIGLSVVINAIYPGLPLQHKMLISMRALEKIHKYI